MTEEARARFTDDEIKNLKEIQHIMAKQGYLVDNTINKAIEAMKLDRPCDLCIFNPPSSMDGKPCPLCPAERKN